MNLNPAARSAEEFDRALRDGSSDGAWADELQVTSVLAAFDVRPDPAFTATLRSSLMAAAAASPIVPALAVAPVRPRKRRWGVAAPVAAVVLATGGVSFAVAGLTAGGHSSTAAGSHTPVTAASALDAAHARLAAIDAQLKAGTTDSASLVQLQSEALQLQHALIAAFASGANPAAMQDLHDFAVAALAQLSAQRQHIPANLTAVYMQTLQTLIDIATTAQTLCPACHLVPVQVPPSVAPYVHVPAPSELPGLPTPTSPGAPVTVPSGSVNPEPSTTVPPTPQSSVTPTPPAPPTVPPVSAPPAPTPPPAPQPTVSLPPVTVPPLPF